MELMEKVSILENNHKDHRLSITKINKISKTEKLLRRCIDKFKLKSKNFTDFNIKEDIKSIEIPSKIKENEEEGAFHINIMKNQEIIEKNIENNDECDIEDVINNELNSILYIIYVFFERILEKRGFMTKRSRTEPKQIIDFFNSFIVNSKEMFNEVIDLKGIYRNIPLLYI